MALEMKVYREIHAYEAKVMFGLSWHQLAALAIGIPLAGGLFATIAYLLHMTGNTWKAATDAAMWAVFPVLIPVGLWGWWRPKGLKPERYSGYLVRYYLLRKVVTYGDTYREQAGEEREPVPQSGAAANETRHRAGSRPRRKRPFPLNMIPRRKPRPASSMPPSVRRTCSATRRCFPAEWHGSATTNGA